ncbi:MAG: CRISPR-associated endonuclease Cas2 [Patescibacteria group bacterium]
MFYFIHDREYIRTIFQFQSMINKEKISFLILNILDESKKIVTSYSLQQYMLYDYYELIRNERKNREKILKKKKQIQKSIHYLKRTKLIQESGGKIKLSSKGRIRLIINTSLAYKNKKKKSDFSYLIIFDIPEKHRRIRDLLRRVLYNFGAEMIQKSVFLIKDKESFLYIRDLVDESKIKSFVKLIECNKLIN